MSVGLPSMVIEDWGVWVDVEVPSQGVVRSPLTVTYTISNKANNTTELALTMHVSDAFMFAGHKEVRLRVLPGRREKISYLLTPLLAGTVQLPKLGLTTDIHNPGQPSNFESLLNRILPSHVFIMVGKLIQNIFEWKNLIKIRTIIKITVLFYLLIFNNKLYSKIFIKYKVI